MKGTVSRKRQAIHPPQIQGHYNHQGYEIWCGGQVVYSAGNHVHDSSQPAATNKDRLPLKTIRQFCIKTAREFAREYHGHFGRVERVQEAEPGEDVLA